MNLLGKQLSAYSFVVIALIMVAGLLQGKKMLVMFNIGVCPFTDYMFDRFNLECLDLPGQFVFINYPASYHIR